MKKYLLRFDEDSAMRVLEETQSALVNPINNIVSSLHDAGITHISKNEVAEILNNGIDNLGNMIPAPDIDGLNPLIHPVVMQEHEKKVDAIRRAILKMERKQLFDGTLSTDVNALELLDFSASGFCELSQATKERI